MIISLNFSLPTIAGAEAKPPRSAFPSTPCRRKPTEPNLAKLRQILLTDPKVKAEYDRLGSIFAVVGEMIEARQAAGLHRRKIVSRMGASHPSSRVWRMPATYRPSR